MSIGGGEGGRNGKKGGDEGIAASEHERVKAKQTHDTYSTIRPLTPTEAHREAGAYLRRYANLS